MLFNVAWLICVLGGNLIAVPAAVLVIGVHMVYFSNNKIELLLICLIAAFGVVIDSLFIRSGLLIPPDNSLWPPWWLISLWCLFAITLDHSMKWFQDHLAVAVVMGGIAGTLTYLAGTRLTDFSLKVPLPVTLLIMFLTWCAVFPLCLLMTKSLMSKNRFSV